MKAQTRVQPESHEGLHFLARSMGILALITVLLYLRALLASGFLAVSLDGLRLGPVLAGLLLLGGVALLAALRWERAGGLVAFILGIPIAAYVATAVDNYNLFNAFIYASPLLIAGGLYLLDARSRPAAR